MAGKQSGWKGRDGGKELEELKMCKGHGGARTGSEKVQANERECEAAKMGNGKDKDRSMREGTGCGKGPPKNSTLMLLLHSSYI
jgi:hypothetical protein